jgi:hypothetical protein
MAIIIDRTGIFRRSTHHNHPRGNAQEAVSEECEVRPHTPITPTNSFTASALFWSAACSSTVRLI